MLAFLALFVRKSRTSQYYSLNHKPFSKKRQRAKRIGMLSKQVRILLFSTLWAMVGTAQAPFNCNGEIYRITENESGSTFQRIELDAELGRIQFKDQARFDGYAINGICYRPQDDLVYGLIQSQPFQLCRIDANYELEILATLPLPDSLHFVSGDISPDGRYLVMLGFHEEARYNILARVDLTNRDYPTSMEVFRAQGSSTAVYCTDIAFHPTTNVLFGFDHLQRRLVTIDLDRNIIDNITYPVTGKVQGIVPSIFFDEEGRLFGIGSAGSLFGDRTLFRFNIDNGEVDRLQSLDIDRFPEDACSCPYTLELYKRVNFRQLSPCTSVQFEYILVNRTDAPLTGLSLQDSFPAGFTIQDISVPEQLSAQISGIGTNKIKVTQLELPIGQFEMEVEIWLEEEVVAGDYAIQASLKHTPRLYPEGPDFIFSDDPETIKVGDATRFSVGALEALFAKDFYRICYGDSILLQPMTDPKLSYKWSTGANTPSIWVSAPGEYELQVESVCEQDRTTIHVEASTLKVDLGPPIQVEKGEPIVVVPTILGSGQVISYAWEWLPDEQSTFCPNCDQYEFAPTEEGAIELQVVDEFGCKSSAATWVSLSDFGVYVPNAFSPNGDGQNDRFYMFGKKDYQILSFQIFDRWGNQLFAQKNIFANESQAGWNGEVKGKQMSPGVYIWQAVVLAKNGEEQLLAGDVQLVR